MANKFDLEPECAIVTSSLLWGDGGDDNKLEALRRWQALAPSVRERAASFDPDTRQWPPRAVTAREEFQRAVTAPPAPAAAAEAQGAPADSVVQ